MHNYTPSLEDLNPLHLKSSFTRTQPISGDSYSHNPNKKNLPRSASSSFLQNFNSNEPLHEFNRTMSPSRKTPKSKKHSMRESPSKIFDIFDFFSSKFELASTAIRQFTKTSSRLITFINIKNNDVDYYLKVFKEQRSNVEEALQKIEKDLFNFSQTRVAEMSPILRDKTMRIMNQDSDLQSDNPDDIAQLYKSRDTSEIALIRAMVSKLSKKVENPNKSRNASPELSQSMRMKQDRSLKGLKHALPKSLASSPMKDSFIDQTREESITSELHNLIQANQQLKAENKEYKNNLKDLRQRIEELEAYNQTLKSEKSKLIKELNTSDVNQFRSNQPIFTLQAPESVSSVQHMPSSYSSVKKKVDDLTTFISGYIDRKVAESTHSGLSKKDGQLREIRDSLVAKIKDLEQDIYQTSQSAPNEEIVFGTVNKNQDIIDENKLLKLELINTQNNYAILKEKAKAMQIKFNALVSHYRTLKKNKRIRFDTNDDTTESEQPDSARHKQDDPSAPVMEKVIENKLENIKYQSELLHQVFTLTTQLKDTETMLAQYKAKYEGKGEASPSKALKLEEINRKLEEKVHKLNMELLDCKNEYQKALSSWQANMQSLEQRLEDFLEENIAHQREKDGLSAKHEEMLHSTKSLLAKQTDDYQRLFNTSLSKIESEFKTKTTRLEEIAKLVPSLQEKCSRQSQAIRSYESTISTLNSSLEDKNSRIDTLERSIAALQINIDLEKKKGLRPLDKVLEQEARSAIVEIFNLIKEEAKSDEIILTPSDSFKTICLKIGQLLGLLKGAYQEKLRVQIESYEVLCLQHEKESISKSDIISEIESRLESAQNQISSLNEEKESLEKKILELNQKLSSSEASVSKLKEYEKDKEEMFAQIKTLQIQIENLNNESSQKINTLKEYHSKEIAKFQKEKNEELKVYKQREHEMSFGSQVRTMELSSQVTGLQAEIARLEAELASCGNGSINANQELNRLMEHNKNIEDQNGLLKEQSSRLEELNSRYLKEIARLEEQSTRVQEQNARHEQLNSRLKEQIHTIDEQKARLEQKVLRYDDQSKSFEEQSKVLQTRIKELESQLEEKERSHNEILRKSKDLNDNKIELQNTLAEKEVLEKEYERLEKERNEYRSLLDQQDGQVIQAHKELGFWKHKVSELERNLKENNKKLNDTELMLEREKLENETAVSEYLKRVELKQEELNAFMQEEKLKLEQKDNLIAILKQKLAQSTSSTEEILNISPRQSEEVRSKLEYAHRLIHEKSETITMLLYTFETFGKLVDQADMSDLEQIEEEMDNAKLGVKYDREITEFKEKIMNVLVNYKELSKSHKELIRSLEMKNIENDGLKEELIMIQKQKIMAEEAKLIAKIQKNIDDKEHQLTLANQRHDKDKKQDLEKIASLQKEIERLRYEQLNTHPRQNSDSKDRLKWLEKANQNLELQVENFENQKKSLLQDKEKLQDQVRDLDNYVQDLKTQIHDKNTTINKLKADIEDLHKQIDEIKAHMNDTLTLSVNDSRHHEKENDELMNLKEENATLNAKIDFLNEECNLIKSSYDEIQKILEPKLKFVTSQLEKIAEILAHQDHNKDFYLSNFNKAIDRIQHLVEVSKQFSTFASNQSQFNVQLEKATTMIYEKDNKIEDLNCALEECEEKLKHMTELCEIHKAECNLLKEKCRQLEDKVKNLRTSVEKNERKSGKIEEYFDSKHLISEITPRQETDRSQKSIRALTHIIEESSSESNYGNKRSVHGETDKNLSDRTKEAELSRENEHLSGLNEQLSREIKNLRDQLARISGKDEMLLKQGDSESSNSSRYGKTDIKTVLNKFVESMTIHKGEDAGENLNKICTMLAFTKEEKEQILEKLIEPPQKEMNMSRSLRSKI